MKYAIFSLVLMACVELRAQTAFQFVEMANRKMEEGNTLGAVKDYTSAIQSDGLFAQAYLGRGSVYAELNLFADALQDLNKAIELDSSLSEVYFNRAFVHVKMGETEKALLEYEKYISLRPDDKQGFLARAELLQLSGRSAKADYVKYLELSGNTYEDKLVQASVYLKMLDTNAAMRCLDACILMKPEEADVYKQRGRLFQSTGRRADAIRDLSTALIIEEDARLFMERAEIYVKMEEFALAFSDYQRAAELDPTKSEYQFNCGVYAMENSEYELALGYMRKAAELNFPDREALYYNLGLCAYNTGNREEACSSWSKAQGSAEELISRYCGQN